MLKPLRTLRRLLVPASLRMRLWLLFGTVGLMFMASVATSWVLMHRVERQLRDICERAEPLSATARELEITVVEAGRGVLQYLAIGDPDTRTQVVEDWKKFEENGRKFAALNHHQSNPQGVKQERALAEVQQLGREHHRLGAALMDESDRWRDLQEKHRDVVEEALMLMGKLESQQAGPSIAPLEPERAAALSRLLDLLQTRDNTLPSLIAPQPAAPVVPPTADELLAGLRGFAWRAAAAVTLQQLGQTLETKIALRRSTQESQRKAASDLMAFLACEQRLDGVLDDRLQAEACHALAVFKAAILTNLAKAEFASFGLLGVTLAGMLVVLWSLLRNFSGKVRALVAGAQSLERGNLSARIHSPEDGELGVLIQIFNRMAAAREHSELSLLEAGGKVEMRVHERAAELQAANEHLAREVAERQVTQDQLCRSEHNLRALIDGATDYAILRLDLEGRVETWNEGARRIFGYEEQEILGQSVGLFHPEGLRANGYVKDLLDNARNRGHARCTGQRLRRDGSLFVASCVLHPILDDAGQISGYCEVTQDITEQQQAEDERVRLERQLLQSQKMEAIGTLAAGISHDFNNIISVIMGHAELVHLRGALPPESVPSLEKVLAAGRRATQLVKQIQQFSRHEKTEFGPVDLCQLATETHSLLKGALPSTMELRLELAVEHAVVQGNAVQLQQVLINLATNARDALLNQTGLLTIRLEKEGADQNPRAAEGTAPSPGQVRLSVTDNGQGMDAATLNHIFDPFFTTKPKGKGTGLGLATVHDILKSHQARCQVESEPGRGTSFHFVFPLTEAGASSHPVLFTEHEQLCGGGEHILVVDDEPELRECIRLNLESHGYHVTEATSGREAFALLQPDQPQVDLMLTDKTMPQMDGLELIQHAHLLAPELPVVLTSGLLGESEQELHACGLIHALLPKPIDMNCLLRTIGLLRSTRKKLTGNSVPPLAQTCLA